jgi:phage/conjugal plasmid C-4 type zinc finger TraR family protein
MADVADFANDLVQERLERALAARSLRQAVNVRHSLLFCEGCDEPIPLARRLAVSGCTQCVACQSVEEMMGARHAR